MNAATISSTNCCSVIVPLFRLVFDAEQIGVAALADCEKAVAGDVDGFSSEPPAAVACEAIVDSDGLLAGEPMDLLLVAA